MNSMIQIQGIQLSEPSTCLYFSGLTSRNESFFAKHLTKEELNYYLEHGWRKFGYYYFQPVCEQCNKCSCLRVRVNEFVPSKSQKKVLRKGVQIVHTFKPLKYREEFYEIYADHYFTRFGDRRTKSYFKESYCTRSCPACQSEFYLDNKLIAVGFLDISNEALNSVYFVYRTAFSNYSLGTFSIIKEIEYARSLGLKYYYLGVYAMENKSLSYKDRFKPNEKYDYKRRHWK